MTIDFRKDVRTKEEFKKNIKERTIHEDFYARVLFKEEILQRFPNAQLLDYGVDNTGEVVEIHNSEMKNPDFVLDVDSVVRIVEVKASYKDSCIIKNHQLKNYINKFGDGWMWLFTNAPYIEKINENNINNIVVDYRYIKMSKLNVFLEKGRQLSPSSFGYKPCSGLFGEQLDEYLGPAKKLRLNVEHLQLKEKYA